MKSFSLLFFALLLFACNSQPATDTTDDLDTTVDPMVEREDPMVTQQPSPQLQSTIDAVQSSGGDITALPAGAAVSNIDGWIGELRGMNGTDAIVNDLESLKTELTAGSIDGGRVSQLLSSLADQTRGLAGNTPGLSTLASALEAGAAKLGGK